MPSNLFSEEAIQRLLEEISDKSDELRDLYDRFNELLRRVEKTLNDLSPGVFAWTRDRRFGYGKDSKTRKWGFLISSPTGRLISLWEGGISDRLDLTLCLEDLLEALWKEMGRKCFRVRSATTQVKSLLEAIECQSNEDQRDSRTNDPRKRSPKKTGSVTSSRRESPDG